MGSFLGERQKIVQLVADLNTTAAFYSVPVSLRDVNKVTLVCGYRVTPDNPISSVVDALTSAVHGATFAVYLAKGATVGAASFTAMTSATLVLGMTTVGQLNNWDSIQISGMGTLTTGLTLTLGYGGQTLNFLTQTNGSIADQSLPASADSAFTAGLGSALTRFFPDLEINYNGSATVGDTVSNYVIISPKTHGGGEISAAVTAAASTSNIPNIRGVQQHGVIEFTAAQVAATNASYTHFAIQVDCSVTSVGKSVVAILDCGQNAKSGNRTAL